MSMLVSFRTKMRNLVIQRIKDLCDEFPELGGEISMNYGKLESLSNVQLLNLYEFALCEEL